MSDFKHKPNSGSIFKNDKKETDAHPNAKGDGNFVCPLCKQKHDVWISAWTNKDKNGNPYQKLSFTPKEEANRQGMQHAKKAAEPAPDDFDDDLPF